MTEMKKRLLESARGISTRFFKSRPVAERIFGVKFVPLGPEDYYFDITTPVLAACAGKRVAADSVVLDLGTGAAAAIGLTLWKKTGCRVLACDRDPGLLASAKMNAERNAAPLEFFESRFFDNVPAVFDTVVFNPPYVSTPSGLARGREAGRRTQWDGGPGGTDVIAEFFRELEGQPRPLKVFLGVNRWHMPREKILTMTGRHPGIRLGEITGSRCLPVDVYVLDCRPQGGPA